MKSHLLAAVALTVLGIAHAWPLFALVAAVTVTADVGLLWYHPYGRCRSPFHRGGQNLASSEEAWGRCPRCGGQPRPRVGAAAVAKFIGERYGRRYW